MLNFEFVPRNSLLAYKDCPPGRYAPAPCMLRYFCNVTGGGLTPSFLRPTKEGWMKMRRIVLLLASMALAVIFGS